MAAGFVPIFLIERISYHNPRFPIQNHRWVADLTVIGLSIHALTDGFNLAIRKQTFDSLVSGLPLYHHLPIAFAVDAGFLSDNTLQPSDAVSLLDPFVSQLLAFMSTVGRLALIAPVLGAVIVTGGFSLYRNISAFGSRFSTC